MPPTPTTDYASIIGKSWILMTCFPLSYKGKKDPESCTEEWQQRRIDMELASTVLLCLMKRKGPASVVFGRKQFTEL
eukprot:5750175-Ditylum_brightwellii.AAC.1